MKRKISALICCALLLTSCAAPAESSQPQNSSAPASSADTSSAAVVTVSSAATTEPAAATPSATTSADVEQPDELESEESIASIDTSEPDLQPDVTTTTSAGTTTSATTPITSTSTTAATTSSAATATSSATTAAPEESEEPVQSFPYFEYDNASALRMKAYGIDAEAQQRRYMRLSDSTKLPVIHVSTENGAPILSREDYNNCLVDMFNCDDDYVLRAAEGGIRIRGNSTAYYGDPAQVERNQVPYRIKFSEKTNMLGLNDGAECKSWVLLKATWQIIPDYIAFNLAEVLMKDDYYSSDCEFAHVYVNRQYKGLYLVCEQNQVNKHRVDLPEHDKGYTGTDIGYFYEIDNYAFEDDYWFTVDYCSETLTDLQGTERELVPAEYSIKNDIYSTEQVDFIAAYTNNVYKLMVEAIKYGRFYEFDENWQLADAQDKYSSAYECINAEVDLDSVVNMYILYEIAHDNDCGEGSFYMARDFSGKSSFDRLTFTAPWDFNWGYEGAPARYYYAAAFNDMNFVNQYGDRSNPWFILLMSTDWFKEMVQQRWQTVFNAGEITAALDAIDEYVEYYYDDLQVEGMYYTGNAQELLKWVRTRVKWLNMEWGDMD